MHSSSTKPALLFDLDGTLLNTEELSELAFKEMFELFQRPFSEDFLVSIRGKKQVEWSIDFVKTFHLNISTDTIIETYENLFHRYLDNDLKLMPGAYEILDWSFNRQIPSILVTSSSKSYVKLVSQRLEIQKYFLANITSEDVKKGKPDPEPYILGARLVVREPKNTIAFEDSVNGVISAKASGSMVIAIPSKGISNEKVGVADHIVKDLFDAKEILEKMGL